MAKNKMRLEPSNTYEIEVNDAGECIVFNLDDADLADKFIVAFEKIDSILGSRRTRIAEIEARTDEVHVDLGATVITKNQRDAARLISEIYSEARLALDGFLGDGACKKIFGDKNWFSMFDDLGKQLTPHLEKMGISSAKLREDMVKKYAPNRETRRALK